jgi:Zn-dependent protease with chaperone function
VASEGWLYDGEAAIRYALQASRNGDDVVLLFSDGAVHEVPAAKLTHVEARGNAGIYGHNDKAGWRLGIVDPDAHLKEILPRPQEYGRWVDRIGLVPAVIAGILLSALVLVAGGMAPAWLAPVVPQSVEKRFGETLVGDFAGRFCEGAGGQAAFDSMVRQLSPRASDLRVRVVNAPAVNALALPGGNILIFDELLKKAANPEEVAGVLAHEIAHVEERHTTQAMIRHFGLGTLITAVGGTTGANLETLVSAGHSRGAEREADAGAIRALKRAGISPLPTATFFNRLARQEAKIGIAASGLAYISTHPMSADRERNFREAALKGYRYRSPLTPGEWRALANICINDPRRDEKRLFPRF